MTVEKVPFQMAFGSWWAVQKNEGLSLGLHLDWRRRVTNEGVRFGPYVDLHVGRFVVSVGRNPIYAGDLDLIVSYARGGLTGPSDPRAPRGT